MVDEWTARPDLLASAVSHDVEALEASAGLLTLTRGGMAMPGAFRIGDHVSWNSETGRVRGIIRKSVSAPIKFKGYTVHASREELQYLIESDRTDHSAVHSESSGAPQGREGRRGVGPAGAARGPDHAPGLLKQGSKAITGCRRQ